MAIGTVAKAYSHVLQRWVTVEVMSDLGDRMSVRCLPEESDAFGMEFSPKKSAISVCDCANCELPVLMTQTFYVIADDRSVWHDQCPAPLPQQMF